MHVFIHLCMYGDDHLYMHLGICACTGARNAYACIMRICAYIYINEKWHIKVFQMFKTVKIWLKMKVFPQNIW